MQYRLLVRGEEIQTTDEYLTDDTVTWNPVTDNFAGRAFIGKDWNPIIMQPIRRSIHESEESMNDVMAAAGGFTQLPIE